MFLLSDLYSCCALSRLRFAPVCAASVASRHFFDGADTPPHKEKKAISAKARKLGLPISELMRRGATAYESAEVDEELKL